MKFIYLIATALLAASPAFAAPTRASHDISEYDYPARSHLDETSFEGQDGFEMTADEKGTAPETAYDEDTAPETAYDEDTALQAADEEEAPEPAYQEDVAPLEGEDMASGSFDHTSATASEYPQAYDEAAYEGTDDFDMGEDAADVGSHDFGLAEGQLNY